MLAKYKKEIIAYLTIFFAYILSFGAGLLFIVFNDLQQSILSTSFYADVIATIVIFVIGWMYRNASFYDPYWSLAPFALCFYWTFMSQINYTMRFDFLLLSLAIWGTRLTFNWARGWKGLKHEDWRYQVLRSKTGVYFPLVNFFGIHLFPTTIVFLCMLPAYFAVRQQAYEAGLLDVIAFMICIIATLIELVADEQQRNFRSERKDERDFCTIGLWRYSRHPNYFGEVLFWWGIYLFVLAANASFWWTIIGPVLMTMMFIFISIPMMEEHMLHKNPEYAKYQRYISMLVPWY